MLSLSLLISFLIIESEWRTFCWNKVSLFISFFSFLFSLLTLIWVLFKVFFIFFDICCWFSKFFSSISSSLSFHFLSCIVCCKEWSSRQKNFLCFKYWSLIYLCFWTKATFGVSKPSLCILLFLNLFKTKQEIYYKECSVNKLTKSFLFWTWKWKYIFMFSNFKTFWVVGICEITNSKKCKS